MLAKKLSLAFLASSYAKKLSLQSKKKGLQSALEAVVAADTERTELLDEQAKLEASDDPADLKRLEEISNELIATDAWGAESRAAGPSAVS